MRDILVLTLFSIGAAFVVAAMALMLWVVTGTSSRMNRRDPSSWGPILFGLYGRHLVAALALGAVGFMVFALLIIVDKRLQ
ncbi:MAG: hypothetical protein K2Y71_29690 [Xanthobacteraceae bacterium]|nr:hypothetical protein [Xanthobacteraceae bacterium]